MSEEEKEAIKELKNKREYFEFQPEGCNWRLSFDQEEVNTIIDVVINLIDKLQKENEVKDKVIDKLAQWVANSCPLIDKQTAKDIIYKEVKL